MHIQDVGMYDALSSINAMIQEFIVFICFSYVDCEHLIRRMLVLDPSKRLSIGQIKDHKWMVIDVPVQRPMLYQQTAEGEVGVGEYSEQVLRLMHSLGIDQHKTIEVRSHS